MDSSKLGRRPLKTRSTAWAQRTAALLARTFVTPNQISVISVLFATLGAASVLASQAPWSLLVCAVTIQLRLACNMLDGMVAVEGGKQTPTGSLYNEIPDRIADSMFIVALGYAAGVPALGWAAALLATLTAYIRALGGALGLPQDFRGPLAKPHRMAVLTAACVLAALESAWRHSLYTLAAAEGVIAVGSLLTCIARTRAIAGALQTRGR